MPARLDGIVVGSRTESLLPEDANSLKSIDDEWDPQVGDARQELVLIGIKMDERTLRRAWMRGCSTTWKWRRVRKLGSDSRTLFLRGITTLRTRYKPRPGSPIALSICASERQLPHEDSSATCSTSPVAPRSTNATTPSWPSADA